MNSPTLRKARNYFDTAQRPVHVTFDDGMRQRRNFPWLHFVEARWEYSDPDTIKVFIGDLVVLIIGHNLVPLYTAIEEQTLARLRAQPELAKDRDHDPDSFVAEIRFLKPAPVAGRNGQIELELGAD